MNDGEHEAGVELEEGLERLPSRRRRSMKLRVLVAALVSLAVLGATAGVWAYRRVNPAGAPGGEVAVEVAQGASNNAIARELERQGVVTDAALFRWYLSVFGSGDVQAGQYSFRRNEHMNKVVRTLEAGAKVERVRLTVPEGLTLDEVAARVGKLPGRSAERFLALARSGQVRSQLQPAGSTNLEGLLWPDTYFFTEEDDEAKILGRLVVAFDERALALGYPTMAARLGLTPYEAVVVASLIEEEAKVDQDRGMIAQVIANRLQQGMPLQIDATVTYALGDHRERLLNRDLEVESPYNTYRVKGLPPTPIAGSGAKSLEAALNPTPGPWIYYVLIDRSGQHGFATTEAEFDRLRAEARSKGLI